MVFDFFASVSELFVATWDFLSYGKKRMVLLHRAYRYGGWKKVRRVSAGRKVAIALWMIFVAMLAACLVFAWMLIIWVSSVVFL